MTGLLPLIRRNGVRVVTNMGAANPIAGAEKIVGARAQARPEGARRGAHRRRRARRARSRRRRCWRPASRCRASDGCSRPTPISASRRCCRALESGADIVLTGRVADPSLALAPLAHHFGWTLDDVDRFARGTVVGHLLECAGQLTGGYYADPGKKDVPGMASARLSVRRRGRGRQCAALQGRGHRRRDQPHDGDRAAALRGDRSERLSDAGRHGGFFRASRSPRPRRTRSRLPARAARTRPDTLKVSVGYHAGYIGEGEISYAGENCVARAQARRRDRARAAARAVPGAARRHRRA